MAIPTGTYDAYQAGSALLTGLSNREDLADIIYNISPTETPFMAGAGRGTARNAKHEWLKDELASPISNYNVEGDDYAGVAITPPNRLHSYTQISAKSIVISGTQESVDKAGRKSEIAYQLSLRARELKRDIERHSVGFADSNDVTNISGVAANGDSFPNVIGVTDSTERITANVPTWFDDAGADRGVGGDSATFTAGQPDDETAAGPGTERALLESSLKAAIRGAWDRGGNPGTILVDPFNKQVVSSFTGGTTKFDKSEDKRLVTAIDIYVSDFGDHQIIPDRFIISPEAAPSGTSCYVLDMNYWGVHYLRPFQQTPLAKTGDSEKRLLLAEWCICAKNPDASAVIADLVSS